MLIENFTHQFGRMLGVEERTPLEMLQCLASQGEPAALELLKTIPHHGNKVGRTPAEEIAIISQIEETITRIFVTQDIEIHFSS